MKRLRTFAYHTPASIADAVELLAAADGPARVLAGGTDLIVDMKTGRMRPSTVVNLKRIPGLSGIEAVGGGTRIGALTPVTEVASAWLVRDRHPGLAEAASLLASPPVRALATIGGNVGRASPASDLGPALIVHDARATIVGPSGSSDQPVEELYVGPGVTTLTDSDVIVAFVLPLPPAGFGSSHVKVGKRGSGTDIALAGVSASIVVDGGSVTGCRLAMASLAPTPRRVPSAEALVLGRAPTGEVIAAAAAAVARAASPIRDVRASAEYRRSLAEVLTRRALVNAVESARRHGGAP